ncbi:hypothetical protein I7I51_06467 [Histoplasma capsulatum]|uniref:Uncharacterized protein n=1 Tax=Ajellomyces capsulatus TaxID=5037 RepID=A0A8A1MHX2_AJECA|nr:hypothetical protein I7I51_06467 [Histoplasma capsulatum]
MLFDGQFARRYVKQSFLTDEEASRVLWRKTEDLVLFHMRHTSVYASTFTLSTDGHGVLELWWREKEPKIPPVLLGCPGIALREVYEHPAKDIIPDCHNADFLKPGSKLVSLSGPIYRNPAPFGTLGCLLTVERDEAKQHVIVTAGHVLDDDGDKIHAEDIANDSFVVLKTVPKFERTLGYPGFRRSSQRNRCLDEICFLEVPESISAGQLPCCLGDVDCIGLPLSEDPSVPSLFPGDLDPEVLRLWVASSDSVRVFKNGSGTGRTTGKLVLISKVRTDDPSLDQTTAYQMQVKWTDLAIPFAEGGDSGSLVFATDGTKIIPLGIHFGSRGIHSFAYMLYSWVSEVELEFDVDVYFCSTANCTPGSRNMIVMC